MREQVPQKARWSRRSFLGLSAAAAATALFPSRALAGTVAAKAAPERVLSFFNTHTGERLSSAYCCGGAYQPDALERINFILRDFRVNEVKPNRSQPARSTVRASWVAGLRSAVSHHFRLSLAQTNAMLRARGGAEWASRRAACTWSARPSTSASPVSSSITCGSRPGRCSSEASASTRARTSCTSIPAACVSGEAFRQAPFRCSVLRPRSRAQQLASRQESRQQQVRHRNSPNRRHNRRHSSGHHNRRDMHSRAVLFRRCPREHR